MKRLSGASVGSVTLATFRAGLIGSGGKTAGPFISCAGSARFQMAESVGVPVTDEDEAPARRSYPWSVWSAEPFAQWVLYPSTDFDGTPDAMDITIRTWAGRKGLGVKVSRNDPGWLDRVIFCFFRKGQPKPRLDWALAALSTAEQETTAGETVTCEICEAVQARAPHLLHIKECLVMNTTDPRDTTIYARHREDKKTNTGMRAVPLVGSKWTLDEGPTT